MKPSLDLSLWERGVVFCGVDEAGRGALAGPVVAAAVVMPKGRLIPGVDDSKKLTSRRRRELRAAIGKEARTWAVCLSSNAAIDRNNILQATYQAMRRAVCRLRPVPERILVDGWRIPDTDIPCTGVTGGDSRSYSIACASILAKVHRDHIMELLDRRFPVYGFAQNKGYPTRAHAEALRRYGPCLVHRRTFGPVARCEL